ncbi:MAG: hypothetical protein M3Q33_05860 [Acidobacteriota bacterium]|nr:hypothetical protein [Acidobacteriota bacterium]
MSQRNKNNSIIFLTTLSVYLGLVLVGGTPSILTYAALTRNFDIQNEIEVSDDLDNKPDNEETESFSKDDFPLLFAQLLNEIKEQVDSGKISLPLQTDFNVEGEFHKSEFSGGGGIGSNVSNQHLSLLIQNTVNQSYKPKAFELADLTDEKSKTVEIRLEANNTDLSLKISFSKSKAEQFAEFLNQEFSFSTFSIEDKLLKQIYENTEATSENNQVFIVTRLPRGSLNALLAQKDAQ